MHIFRVEGNFDGDWIGIFRHKSLDIVYSIYPQLVSDVYDMPDPYHDERLCEVWREIGYKDNENKWKFGFESYEQFLKWFKHNEIISFFAGRTDVRLAVYKLPKRHVYIGDWQVIFKHQKAELVDSFTFDMLDSCKKYKGK